MAKKKVLEIITLSEFGGAQKQIEQIIQYSYEQFDYSLCYGGSGEAFNHLKCQKFPLACLKRPINPVLDLCGLYQLYQLIKKLRPDTVHCHSSKAGILGRLAAKLAGVKNIIYTVHGFVFKEPGSKYKQRFYTWLEKLFAIKFTDKLICVSQEDYFLALHNHMISGQRLCYIPNGIDFSQYPTAHKVEGLLRGLCIANFYPAKGHRVLIEAVAQLPEAKFTIDLIGKNGGCEQQLKALVRKYKLEKVIDFKGFLKVTPEVFAGYNFFVLPSLKEGFPFVVLEALAAGLPVITSKVGGNRDLIQDGENGFLCQPGSIDELKQALQKTSQGYKFKIDRAKLEEKYSIRVLVNEICSQYL